MLEAVLTDELRRLMQERYMNVSGLRVVSASGSISLCVEVTTEE